MGSAWDVLWEIGLYEAHPPRGSPSQTAWGGTFPMEARPLVSLIKREEKQKAAQVIYQRKNGGSWRYAEQFFSRIHHHFG